MQLSDVALLMGCSAGFILCERGIDCEIEAIAEILDPISVVDRQRSYP